MLLQTSSQLFRKQDKSTVANTIPTLRRQNRGLGEHNDAVTESIIVGEYNYTRRCRRGINPATTRQELARVERRIYDSSKVFAQRTTRRLQ